MCAKGQAICIPSNYSKFDLPNETLTVVHVGIDIKDIPKVSNLRLHVFHNASEQSAQSVGIQGIEGGAWKRRGTGGLEPLLFTVDNAVWST